jgi:hypothetical protein
MFKHYVGKVGRGRDWLSIPVKAGRRFGLVFLEDGERFFFGFFTRIEDQPTKEKDNE